MLDNFRKSLAQLIYSPRIIQQSTFNNVNESIIKNNTDRKLSPNSIYQLLNSYQNVSINKRQFKTQMMELESYYIVDAIFQTVADDALSPDITTNEVLAISSEDSKINEELKALQSRFHFDEIIMNSIVYPLLRDGENYLQMVVEPERGVVELVDDVDSTNVVSMYSEGFPIAFITTDAHGTQEIQPPSKFAHFILRPQRLNDTRALGTQTIDVSNSNSTFVDEHIRDIRFGKPLLKGIVSKIKDLILLETMIPAIPLSNLSHGSIIGVEVPPTMEPNDAMKLAQRYEDIFNKQLGISQDSQMLTAADVLGVAGRFRIIPTYGNRGNLQNLDLKTDQTLQLVIGSIDTIRSVILSSIGIPPSIIFGGSNTVSDDLRLYNRYTRKLKGLQRAIAGGISQICLAHLLNRGFTDITIKSFKIEFRNQLVNIDEIQKMDYYSQMITNFQGIEAFITAHQDPSFGGNFDYTNFESWIAKRLNTFFTSQGTQ